MKQQDLYSQYRRVLPSSYLQEELDRFTADPVWKRSVAVDLAICKNCRHYYLVMRRDGSQAFHGLCLECGEDHSKGWWGCQGMGHEVDPLATLVALGRTHGV